MNDILKQAQALYEAGLAIHWVKPKSKAPVEGGWTTGPRKSWDYLKKTYKPGYNLGVRTGSASKLKEGYLTCIDVDVKKPEAKKDALNKLKEIVDGYEIKHFGWVESGAGNGSRHLYCVSPSPFKMLTAAKEPGFEICIYSEGRQMVLPPSVHPSGSVYKWRRPINGHLPVFDVKRVSTLPKNEKRVEVLQVDDIKFKPVDIDKVGVSDEIRENIKNGTNVLDRSAYLLPCVTALHSVGLSRDEILSVLTDSTLFMGRCAYDHAQTQSRTRAAQWLDKFTVQKVLRERDPVSAFKDAPPVERVMLDDASVEAQSAEIGPTESSAENGFYYRGAKGGLIPDYTALLKEFERGRPFRTIADMKSVYTFNGTHYAHCTPIEIRAFAEEKFSPKPEEKLRAEFYHKVLANKVCHRSFFNETTEGRINFKNGVLDLNVSDTALLPHSPDFGFRGVLPYNYDPSAECPIFLSWLDEVMLGDKELSAILQEFMGYIIRGGDYKYHKALWLGGAGRNGKSTFVDLAKALIGAGNFSVLSIKGLMTDKFAGADLDGKIANFSEETSPQELADSGPFKNLTGDGDIFAQKKYGDPYSFRNRAKLIMTYNQIPDLKDLSPGMLSRPLIIPFEKFIEDGAQDRNIKKKLFSELPGIFNFALDGWRRLESQEGFTVSKKSNLAMQKIKEESCSVYQWIENFFVFCGEHELPQRRGGPPPSIGEPGTYRPNDIFAAYVKHEKFTYKAPEFYRRFNAHPEVKKRKIEGRNFNYYFGLKIPGFVVVPSTVPDVPASSTKNIDWGGPGTIPGDFY